MAHFEIELPDLAPFQSEWLTTPERFVVVEGATGTGKTFVHEPHLFKEAHSPVNSGDEYWWISPTLAQARAVFDDIVRILEASDAMEAYRVSKMPMAITTPMGGVMRFLTADNPDYFYGVRNVREIIVDEFTRTRPSLWSALLTVANKTGARIRLIGNYMGDTSPWHRWVETMQGDPQFRYFRTTALEAIRDGIMPQAMFDTARRALPAGVFAALYLCEGTHDPSMLVEYAAVNDLWLNEHVPEGDPALSCDIALQGSDRFVMCRWSGWRLKEIEVIPKLTASQVVDVIKGKANAYGVPRSRIVYDGDGLGMYLGSYLDGAREYRGGSVYVPQGGQVQTFVNLRAQAHFGVAGLINSRGIYIETPMHRSELEQEVFACLRTNGQDAAGRWGIYPKDHATEGAKARLGRSPDLFDPIPMRMFLDLLPKSNFAATATELARVAHKKRVSFKRDRDAGGFAGR